MNTTLMTVAIVLGEICLLLMLLVGALLYINNRNHREYSRKVQALEASKRNLDHQQADKDTQEQFNAEAADKYDQLASSIESLRIDLDAALKEGLSTLSTSVERVRTETNPKEGFNAIASGLSAIDAELESIKRDTHFIHEINTCVGYFGDIKDSIEGFDRTNKALHHEITAIKGEILAIRDVSSQLDKLVTLEQDIETLKERNVAFNRHLNDLENTVERTESELQLDTYAVDINEMTDLSETDLAMAVAETTNPPPKDESPPGEAKTHFHADRVFYQASTDGMDHGWYFHLRGGKLCGPYGTKEKAEDEAKSRAEQFAKSRDSGGRA